MIPQIQSYLDLQPEVRKDSGPDISALPKGLSEYHNETVWPQATCHQRNRVARRLSVCRGGYHADSDFLRRTVRFWQLWRRWLCRFLWNTQCKSSKWRSRRLVPDFFTLSGLAEFAIDDICMAHFGPKKPVILRSFND